MVESTSNDRETGSRGRRLAALAVLLLLLIGSAVALRLTVFAPPPSDVAASRTGPADSAIGTADDGPGAAAEDPDPPPVRTTLPDGKSGEIETVPWRGEAGTGALTGRVVRAGDGTPCADAPVMLADSDRGDTWLMLRGRPCSGGRRTRTDSDGRFRFLGLPPGDYCVGANPLDGPASTAPSVEVEEAFETRVRLVVPPGQELHGRVIHERTGAPVENARVSVRLSPGVVVRTDEKGRFVLPGVATGMTTILVHAPECPPHEFARLERQGDRLVGEFVVGASGSISGRVQNGSGETVVGAWVSVSVSPRQPEGETGRPWTCPVRTGPDGRFTLTGLPLGLDLPLFARAEGHALGVSSQAVRFQSPRARTQHTASAILRVAAPGAHVTDVVITLRRSGSLALEIVDESGRPVEGAEVEGWERLADQLDRWLGEGIAEGTDAEGRICIPELPAGPCELLVCAEGFLEASARVVIEAGRLTASRVVLSRGGVLEGRVVYPDGEPGGMPELEILPVVGPPDPSVSHELGDVDDDGCEFTFTGLDVDREYVVVAVDETVGVSEPIRVRGGQSGVVLALRPFGSVRGRVLDSADGSAVTGCEGCELQLEPLGNSLPHRACGIYQMENEPVDAEGRFVLRFVAPGRYSADLHHLDDDDRVVVPTVIEVEPGRETKDVLIRLAPPRWLDLAVRWDSGGPVAGLSVEVLGGCPRFFFRSTSLDASGRGRLALPLAVSTPLLVKITGRDGAMSHVRRWRTVTLGPEVRTLTLTAGPKNAGSLSFFVVDERGKGIPGASVVLRDVGARLVPTGGEAGEKAVQDVLDHPASSSPVLRRGGFRYPGLDAAVSRTDSFGGLLRGSLAPGRYRAEIEAEGYEPVEMEVEVTERRRAQHHCVLRRR